MKRSFKVGVIGIIYLITHTLCFWSSMLFNFLKIAFWNMISLIIMESFHLDILYILLNLFFQWHFDSSTFFYQGTSLHIDLYSCHSLHHNGLVLFENDTNMEVKVGQQIEWAWDESMLHGCIENLVCTQNNTKFYSHILS